MALLIRTTLMLAIICSNNRNIDNNLLISFFLVCRLEGTLNRYRRLDVTVGEKEMAIAELQAKYAPE